VPDISDMAGVASKSGCYDAVIIGAGMSGLAAGIRLAYYDRRVLVLDRHTMPGGLNSFYRLGKRNFDVGLHAMTNYVERSVRNAPLNKLLRQLRRRAALRQQPGTFRIRSAARVSG